MVRLQDLVAYADQLLDVEAFADYAPNGLQVEGRTDVRVLISGVTASAAWLDAAIAAGADALLVHHGYFWRGEDTRVSGMRRRRLKTLLTADVSLLAYHLPLDAHPLYGNNTMLAQHLDFAITGRFGAAGAPALACSGRLAAPLDPSGLAAHLGARLGRPPLHVAGRAAQITTIGFCTGAAQDYIEQAAALGLDAYLTGEVSERTVHQARELGIHFYAAGHHATERYGVQALGAHLAAHFGISHRFFDDDNPV